MSLTDAPNGSEPKRKSFWETLLRLTTVGLVIAILYVAWTFYSRYQANREAQQRIEAERAEARKRVVDQVYGSGGIKFNDFSADSGSLLQGESTELCYGVLNAKTVKIDPPVGEDLKPSYRHCIEIKPTKTTTYTITAEDGAGHLESHSLTIRVR